MACTQEFRFERPVTATCRDAERNRTEHFTDTNLALCLKQARDFARKLMKQWGVPFIDIVDTGSGERIDWVYSHADIYP